MFYFWMFVADILLLSVYGQLHVLFQGYIPNIVSMAMSIALLIAVSGMAYRKYNEAHENSKCLLNAGYCLFIIAFFILIQKTNYVSFENLIRGLEFASLLILPGLFLVKYNTQTSEKIAEDRKRAVENHYDLFEVVYLLEQVSDIKKTDRQLNRTIGNCIEYLIVLEQNQYLMNQELIKLLISLFDNYLELETLSVRSEKIIQVQERIEKLLPDIEKALENAYNNSIHAKIDEAEINLKVLETYLKQNIISE